MPRSEGPTIWQNRVSSADCDLLSFAADSVLSRMYGTYHAVPITTLSIRSGHPGCTCIVATGTKSRWDTNNRVPVLITLCRMMEATIINRVIHSPTAALRGYIRRGRASFISALFYSDPFAFRMMFGGMPITVGIWCRATQCIRKCGGDNNRNTPPHFATPQAPSATSS